MIAKPSVISFHIVEDELGRRMDIVGGYGKICFESNNGVVRLHLMWNRTNLNIAYGMTSIS